MRTLLDAEALSAWAALALDGMRTHRRAIDALNVFPVPDGDTGTNMYLTLEAGVEAMLAVGDDVPEPGSSRLRALARGMLLGARGNSGVIASELIRGVAASRAADLTRPTDGAWLADALERAADGAYNAVSNPKEGTLLTVARAAADAAHEAAEQSGGQLSDVAQAAARVAREALGADHRPAGGAAAGGRRGRRRTGLRGADRCPAGGGQRPARRAARVRPHRTPARRGRRRRRTRSTATAGRRTRSCICSTLPTTSCPG